MTEQQPRRGGVKKPCGCGGRSKPDAANQARQAKQAERHAAVEAARRAIANGATPTVIQR